MTVTAAAYRASQFGGWPLPREVSAGSWWRRPPTAHHGDGDDCEGDIEG